MSEPENFLGRWSRLKREREEEAAKAKATSSLSPGVGAAVAEGERDGTNQADESNNSSPPGLGEVKEGFDLSSLPSLESITAETDIKAFLSPGVPAELRHAALRRAWSADPNIRDFVGLAEYAWDFNAPDSMPGFGPLEMTDELRRIARNIVGGLEPDEPPATEETPEAAAPVQEVAGDDTTPEPARDEAVHRNTEYTAAHAKESKADEPEVRPPRRGGGALPS